jgi:hypothetical protein
MIDFSKPAQQAVHGQLIIRFKKPVNDLLILDWLVCSNLSFNIVNDTRWRRQQLYNNPVLEEKDLPHSKTLVRLLLREYHRALPKIRAFLRSARGLIHLTFDGWTSRRFTSFVGLTANFIDKDFNRWTILLGLPPLMKRHRGSDIAEEILAIIRFFEIQDCVGYCTLDNESKNRTTMAKIGEALGLDAEERQISCGPHVLQLCTRALMYGEGCKRLPLDQVLRNWLQDSFADEDEENEALERAFDEVAINPEEDLTRQDSASEDEDDDALDTDPFVDTEDEDDEYNNSDVSDELVEAAACAFDYSTPSQLTRKTMEKYQKRGPFGKLHNHGNCFHRSSQLVGAFRDAQTELDPSATTKEWVHNNATRWQSDEAMAARALELQPAIKRLHQNLEYQWDAAGSKEKDKPPVLEFKLGAQDWRVVEAIQNILSPFKFASKKLQGIGPAGSLDQYFPQMEYLLLHLESCAQGKCYVERENPIDPTGDPIPGIVKIFEHLGDQERRFLKAYIRVGLWKLQHYYDKLTSLAYAAAVVFNPSLKMTGLQGIFDAEPQRQGSRWRDHYTTRLRERWEEDYKNK